MEPKQTHSDRISFFKNRTEIKKVIPHVPSYLLCLCNLTTVEAITFSLYPAVPCQHVAAESYDCMQSLAL